MRLVGSYMYPNDITIRVKQWGSGGTLLAPAGIICLEWVMLVHPKVDFATMEVLLAYPSGLHEENRFSRFEAGRVFDCQSGEGRRSAADNCDVRRSRSPPRTVGRAPGLGDANLDGPGGRRRLASSERDV